MQEGGKLYKDMNRYVAYYKGMTTWSRWVNRFVDPSKTRVFFQGVSPVHYEYVPYSFDSQFLEISNNIVSL